MKIHEKIKDFRKKKGMTQQQLHDRIKQFFAQAAIDKRTLQRIEKGHTDGRASSLHQISFGLGIQLKDLLHDSESMERSGFSRWDTYQGRYVYNPKAFAEVMSSTDMNFSAIKLNLEPKGKTSIEKDPDGEIKYIKWIYVLRGALILHVEEQKYLLKQNHCATFYSFKQHFFENPTNKKVICIITQNPRYI